MIVADFATAAAVARGPFMKILAGLLKPSAGNVSLGAHERMVFLRRRRRRSRGSVRLDFALQSGVGFGEVVILLG